MTTRPIAILFLLFVLAMIQTSFLNHFAFFDNEWLQIGNLVALFVLVYALLEKRKGRLSWVVAVWGGILLDLFSNMRFGVWTLSFIVLVFAIKVILKRYVSIPSFW